MKQLKKVLLTLVCIGICSTGFSLEKAFYILRSNSPAKISTVKTSFNSLDEHFNKIDLLVSQAYQVDAQGMTWGFIDADVIAFAKKHHVKLIALITNAKFDKEIAHRFLSDPAAQAHAIKAILSVCQQLNLYGVQFDFEMVALQDRDALTNFYQMAAKVLHEKHYNVSFAVAPLVMDNPQASNFLKRIYENWEGAYDLEKLGASADFISIMAYNQHGSGTTPGPTAGVRWVEAVIQYALKYVPANKISLGIPVYSSYWFTDETPDTPRGKISMHLSGISYEKVNYLINKHHANLLWDKENKMEYAVYDHNWLNEYIFVENDKSFKGKLDLVKKYKLRGISVFDLGTEDPRIWNLL